MPPPFSGYPVDDRSGWPAYEAEYRRTRRDCTPPSTPSARARAPPLPELEFIHTSPWLNLWLYPDEADYRRAGPLGGPGTTCRPASARPRSRGSPAPLASGEGPLLYLSLGSLGSADIELMRKLIDSLAPSPTG